MRLKDGTNLGDALVERIGAVNLFALRLGNVETSRTWWWSGSVQCAEGNGVSVGLRVDEFPFVPDVGDLSFEFVRQSLVNSEAISFDQRRFVVFRVVYGEGGILQDEFAQFGSKSVLVEGLPCGAVRTVKSTV